MSVRAYRVKKIIREERPSFNLWHDDKLRDFLTDNASSDQRNDDGGGMLEVSTDTLKEALDTLELDNEQRKALQADIDATENAGEEFVLYDCY